MRARHVHKIRLRDGPARIASHRTRYSGAVASGGECAVSDGGIEADLANLLGQIKTYARTYSDRHAIRHGDDRGQRTLGVRCRRNGRNGGLFPAIGIGVEVSVGDVFDTVMDGAGGRSGL